MKTYEAIYRDGQIHWVGEQPDIAAARVLVTIVEEYAPEMRAKQAAQALLELEGTEPDLQDIPRRRWDSLHEDSR